MCSQLIKIGERTNTREEDEESSALIGGETYIPAQCNLTPSENLPADEEDDGALQCAIHLNENCIEAATSTERNDGPSFYEETSITYFAGYIVHHIMRKYDCTECRNSMLKTPLDVMEPAENYIATREYSDDDDDDEYAPDVTKLSRPTEAFVKIITTQLKIFQNYWGKFWHQENVLEKLCRTAIQRSKIENPGWFNEDNSCYAHRVAALKHLYKVKLHDQARKRNEEEKSLHKPTKSQKLKNILHK
ncbi:uncharacterized protein LOC143214141 [Lasioglossum baleicum]|uniref:uncharacterized protein LOC143214141 n=1 Tax=Lasioglossum baleicum TaxID=434251 RepID=UPI003FCE99D3